VEKVKSLYFSKLNHQIKITDIFRVQISTLLVVGVGLLPKAASRGQLSLTTRGSSHDSAATGTNNHSLGMAEDGLDFKAAGAFHIHEKAVGSLHQSLLFVLSLLVGEAWVEKINS